MDFINLHSAKCSGSQGQFWKAMALWTNKPHLVNRQISSSIPLLTASVVCDVTLVINRLSAIRSPSEFFHHLSQGSALDALDIKDQCAVLTEKIDPFDETLDGNYLIVNQWLPRNGKYYSNGIECIVIDKKSRSILFSHRRIDREKQSLGSEFWCKLSYDEANFCISVENTEKSSSSERSRLKEGFFPRLLKWIEHDDPKKNVLLSEMSNKISLERYAVVYSELKEKYGLEMVKKWTECTDPNKYVWEDVAIATYLLLLWEKQREETGVETKQSFVDLGCGNGLLVYILTSEGHPGLGIDLRRRKIWDMYPSTTRLEERTIVPSASSVFPEFDWIIGNHTDELTPWVPVIAARSSYRCRFFLLPCCAFNFDGRKYQRENAAQSQYSEYLKFVKTICEGCGFDTSLLKLRIPSTKRICLIGGPRTYPEEKSDEQDELIKKLINSQSCEGNEKASDPDTQWSRDFKPRETVERVRNCTQIDRSVIDEIVNLVASHLLKKVRIVRKEELGTTWNAGGHVELADIAKIVSPETLKRLKNECGGLQTLLRNNSHIFQVVGGKVRFRVPGGEDEAGKRKRKGRAKVQRLRVKPCWFHANHPDGCPMSDELCNFKH